MRLLQICLICIFATIARCSLLEMSKMMWAKLVSGDMSKTSRVDPLIVPVIKIDQAEGDTSYKMVLNNVRITGLNNSTLESIHVARGRLKSNITEFDAGYVSYSDLAETDTMKYRYRSMIDSRNAERQTQRPFANYRTAPRDSITRDEPDCDRENNRKNYGDRYEAAGKSDNYRNQDRSDNYRSQERMNNYRSQEQSGNYRSQEQPGNYRSQEQLENYRSQERPGNYRSQEQPGNYRSQEQPGNYRSQERPGNYRSQEQSGVYGNQDRSENYRDRNQDRNDRNDRYRQQSQSNYGSRAGGNNQNYQQNQERIENKSGYVDIVYVKNADNGRQEERKSGRLQKADNHEVRDDDDFESIMKAIRENQRFIIHNFTRGESLFKRNDAMRTAMEAKRMRDMIRYANDYQEREGYFEEGMRLIYHYGGMGDRNATAVISNDANRHKRAHDDEKEDETMHVTMRIQVPMLRATSHYRLMGKVGSEILHGNGLLVGNFTDLICDFSFELRKVDNDTMIVKTARAKLSAKSQKIMLEGMDMKGPVESVLNRGLMAAEAVAAMLADDLATKALSEKTADAIIYRMYKNLPTEDLH